MRALPFAIASALVLASLSASLQGQQRPAPVDARSLQLVGQAKAARAAGSLDTAADLLETALAVDPRNRDAFVTLAEVMEARGLPGKAIRLYREALALEPNDVLAKIRTLCKTVCPAATQLAAVIAKGPPVTTAAAETGDKPKPE